MASPPSIPYGIYDLHRNEGWVSIGIDHDTASFAVHAIRRWWRLMGRAVYRSATSLLITADSGGSNGSRVRLWKWELGEFARRTGVSVTVYPQGISPADEQMAQINLERHTFHGDWNYTIHPDLPRHK